ncbi:hypothetical protein lerEdw1_003200 [Lerista edwardsae]|nr:hypothetical protein lerEdw1_003200 [Lerista edwardsae]
MAFLVHPPVCLFLLIVLSSWPMGAAAAVVPPIPEGLVWKDSKHLQAPAEIKRSEQRLFLSGLADWASHMNEAPLSRKKKVELSPRQEKATFPQPPARERAPLQPWADLVSLPDIWELISKPVCELDGSRKLLSLSALENLLLKGL